MDYLGQDYAVVAKTCGCKSGTKVAYVFTSGYDELCIDKKEILLKQIQACQNLLGYARNEQEKETIEKEMQELRLALDMLQ